MKYLFFVVCLAFITACNNSSQQEETKIKIQPEFNTSDKSIETNNNIPVAFNKYMQNTGGNDLFLKIMSADEITKSPYSSLGKMVVVKGQVYKVEELPPDPNLPGKMHEILLLAKNSNSPLGITTVDCMCIGDIKGASPKQIASCGGYFVGTFNSPNAVGGTVEALVIVGNVVHK